MPAHILKLPQERKEREIAIKGILLQRTLNICEFFPTNLKNCYFHTHLFPPAKRYVKREKGTVNMYGEYLFPSLSANDCAFNLKMAAEFPDLFS